MPKFSLGFDFGTESVRVVVVNIRDGRIAGQSVERYAHGVIDGTLPSTTETLPPDYALQHPQDWLDALAQACRSSLAPSRVSPNEIIGIGIDFTSCTMLPCRSDGTPLCLLDQFKTIPLAYPKLWKHRSAQTEAQRFNEVAHERNEPWLARYGRTIGLEWFFPKILETLNHAPGVYQSADLFIDAGDWLVWQLTTGPFPHCDVNQLVLSTCQAGYKAMWNARDGYPSRDYFAAVHPKLANVVSEKVQGVFQSPGRRSGGLSAQSAKLLNLRSAIPVSAAIIDAHCTLPGAGVASPSTMVMCLGGSSRHLLNSRIEQFPTGVTGVVEDGILPGYFGYEAVQPNIGDAGQLSRAQVESTAFDLRRIVESFRDAGVPVRRFVATGKLANESRLMMQIYADVLSEKINVAGSTEPRALGAAILGCIAAGPDVTGYSHISQAIHAMARQRDDLVYRPDLHARKEYEKVYQLYRSLT